MKIIPVIRDSNGVVVPAFEITVELDGTNYNLSFRWTRRLEAWIVDIYDSVDTLLLGGHRISIGIPLYYYRGYSDIPPGFLVALDTTNQDLDPGLTDLGDRVRMIYVGPDEVLA